MTDYRDRILVELQVIQKKEQQDKNVFKARAYTKVIQQLQDRVEPVTRWEDLQGIQGIGEGIRKKIQEVFDTGVVANAEAIRKQSGFQAKDIFLKIYGVGPVKAKELVEKGFRSIASLREEIANNPKSKLLNEKQQLGLKYYEDLDERIPRSEMDEHAEILFKTAKDVFGKGSIKYSMSIVGSYRRKAESSGDIDVLLVFPDASTDTKHWFHVYSEALRKKKYLETTLAEGPKKLMGISRVRESMRARRLDLLVTPKDEYAYALLYFTGSDKFNIAMRKHALNKGYTMNEHGMTPIQGKHGEKMQPVPPFMADEKDIFTFLDYPYVEPENRDGKKIV
jgi:DNA polymerase beta